MKTLYRFFIFIVGFCAPISVLATENWVIGRIILDRRDVFDTGTLLDQQFPYTWANKLHIRTKPAYIRAEILFKEGDPYSEALIEESERILRERSLFRYVTITPQEPVNGVVDVRIRTEDVWTTDLFLSLGAAGGRTTYGIGLQEDNFLGYGVRVGGFLKKKIDRFVRGVSYKDPFLLNTPFEFFSGYGTDEKGKEYELALKIPFRSVLQRQSIGSEVLVRDDEDRLFQSGDEVGSFRHKVLDSQTFFTWALNPRKEQVRRVGIKYEYFEETFADIRGTATLDPPRDLTVSAALLTWDYKDIQFIKRRGVTTFDRDEDLNQGWNWWFEAGPFLKALGSTRDGAQGRAGLQKIWSLTEDQHLFSSLMTTGRYDERKIQDGILQFKNHYIFHHWWQNNTLSVFSKYNVGRNLDTETQFLVGGDSGLRGYSVRELSGSKSFVMNLENRKVVLYDWMQLVTLGWAAFFDIGGAWKEGQQPRFGDLKSNVGLGLRFAPTRSTDPSIIQVDVAYALNDNGRSSRFVFHIGVDVSFGQTNDKKFNL